MKQVMKRSLCLLLALICILTAGCSGDNGRKGSKLKVEKCVVTTDLYEFAYPEGMIDVIQIQEGESSGNLEFYAVLTDSEYKIFDMKYNETSGNFTVNFEKSDGKKVPISFVMHDLPENLSESGKMTFYAAQEAVNDIIFTLVLK